MGPLVCRYIKVGTSGHTTRYSHHLHIRLLFSWQVPYFAIVKRLKEENSEQSKEIKKWYRELSTTKSEVEKINLKIQQLEYRLATKDSSISELKDNIERAKKREERYLTIIEVEEFEMVFAFIIFTVW